MKKQILLLILAFVAGISVTLAQPYAQPGSAPQTVACATDALHPSAGVPYTYTLDATPGGGTWLWYATKNTTFLSAGAFPTDSLKSIGAGAMLLNASGNYGTPGTSNSVTITWSDAILNNTVYQTNPTFVVGYYEAGGTNCADNIKIYQLDPKLSFVVDIKNINPATNAILDYGVTTTQCVDNVQGASYVNNAILYDYGTNYLYYEFIAANFSGHWVPTFALTGLDAAQVVTYEYTIAAPSTWSTTAPTWTPLVSGTTQIQADPNVSTAAGVSIYVRVTVENRTFETLAQQILAMALDGQNSLAQWDVRNDDCTLPNPNAADGHDTATQTIDPRPTVQEGTTSPVLPNERLVPKNP